MGGCCYNAEFTDSNAESVVQCPDVAPGSESDWCQGVYHGNVMESPADYMQLILNPAINDQSWSKCQTAYFYSFVLGLDLGLMGLQAGDGYGTPSPQPGILEKYRSAFEQGSWNVLELLSSLFKGDEFLCSQAVDNECDE